MALAALLASCGGGAGDLFDQDAEGPRAEVGGAGGSRSVGGGRAGAGQGGAASGGVPSSGGSSGAGLVGAGASSALGGAAGAGSGSGSGSGAGNAGSGNAGSGNAGSGNAGSGNASGGAGGDPVSGAGASGGATGLGEPADCDPCPCGEGPFGEPELVAGLGLSANVESFGPAPSADGLTLYLSSVGTQEDIFFGTRSTRANQFRPIELVPGVNDPSAADGTPFISADDRALYFFSERVDPEAPGGRDLWVAARDGAGAPFSAPALVAGVNTDQLEHLPRLTPDGLSMMFVSGRDNTPNLGSNIWQANRTGSSAAFSVPIELPGVNSNGRDEGFWLSADGLTVFFASNREIATDMDIWVATRSAASEAFGEAENLSVVNTSDIEIDPAVTLDGFELFFASDRGGIMQLYRSARLCDE